jgi:hypothetical protein
MPELRRLVIGDDPGAWTRAGFSVDGDRTVLGSVAIRLVGGSDRRVLGWELAGLDRADRSDIDGIATTATAEPAPGPMVHPNGVSRLDHVVIRTTDLARTIAALEEAGFAVRRTRDVPGSSPTVRQVFLWAGEAILEVVGPAPTGEAEAGDGSDRSGERGPGDDRPAAIWGLALTSDDLDGAAELLGSALIGPKDAVQPGRRIATIDTASLGITTPLALMTPHPGGGPPDRDGE